MKRFYTTFYCIVAVLMGVYAQGDDKDFSWLNSIEDMEHISRTYPVRMDYYVHQLHPECKVYESYGNTFAIKDGALYAVTLHEPSMEEVKKAVIRKLYSDNVYGVHNESRNVRWVIEQELGMTNNTARPSWIEENDTNTAEDFITQVENDFEQYLHRLGFDEYELYGFVKRTSGTTFVFTFGDVEIDIQASLKLKDNDVIYKYVCTKCYDGNDMERAVAIAKERMPKEDAAPDNTYVDKCYDVVEQLPSFPGGQAALMQYLNSHIKYPKNAKDEGIEGRVTVQFVVEKDGSISNVKMMKAISPELDNEAMRVISEMPKWLPGRQNGKPCRVRYFVPVVFRL